MTDHKRKVSVKVAQWIYDEILADAPNKTTVIEEALVKLHFSKTRDAVLWGWTRNLSLSNNVAGCLA